ncbi:MAG TPA: patatin-like phospholipase family protein [Acidimicrobiales bacterium]
MADTPGAARNVPTDVAVSPPDGLAQPRDMGAGYGDGLTFGLSLGGGGLFFVAWQTAYLATLAERGVHLTDADRVVGTSAGSLVASVLEAGNLKRLRKEVGLLSKVPKLIGLLAPAGNLLPSQMRASDLFFLAEVSDPDTLRTIGHASLAAATPSASTMARNVGLILASRRWPSPALHVTCVDAYTGERCVVSRESGVLIARAVAASSAVPGLFAPQPILDRRCMDGGVSGTGTHLDLLAGAGRAVVLCLTDGAGEEKGGLTSAPNAFLDEVEALEGAGTKVFHRTPEEMDLLTLMDPLAVPDAIAMGERQAAADADELRTFLAG